MPRHPLLDKYASAIEQGERDRIGVLLGHLDRAEVNESRAKSTRIAIGLWAIGALLNRNRADPSKVAAILADLQDDGQPDWTFWLDRPGRRYRLRPWRAEDGEPWSYRLPCVTVLDGEKCRALKGIPAGAFALMGHKTKLEDTDACCKALFELSVSKKKRAA